MTTAVGGAMSAGTVIIKEGYNCFKHHFDYVCDLDKNYDELINESDDLFAVKRDMETYISQNVAKKMTIQCRDWFLKVRRTESKIKDLEQRYKKANKCLCDMYPFLKLRKLGKSIVDTKEDVVKLKTEMKEIKQHGDGMTTRQPPVATNIVELNSLTSDVQKLLKFLDDKDLHRIGIFGIEGVGKTTLLKKLQAKAGQEHRFDIVIFVSYQEKGSVRMIQKDLLSQLKQPVIGSDSTEEVGDRISKLLENKEYLLLLDQVSSYINLDEVGIRDCHKDGKAVFASRERSICNMMGAKEFLQVTPLQTKDAMTLFQTIVGGDVITNKSMERKAEQIVKELGGLPLVIKTIAIFLEPQNYDKWHSTLGPLQSVSNRRQEYLDDVFNIYEFLYDQLHVDMRKCLLYAALFPGGYEIYDDYLVEGWNVLGFTRDDQGGNGQTFEDARSKGNVFLEDLTESNLLVRCLKEKYIKMPELLRKLALKRLYPKEAKCQVVVGASEEKKWRDARWIALMQTEQLSLPNRPKCGKLSTLLLQRNDRLEIIPKSFFARMKKLQILDLYCTGIELLPPSLFSLIDLKALYLNDCCRLAVLSSKIAKLQNLEILDIRDTGICSLPIEIGKLKNLKCFRVSFPYNDANADGTTNNILMIPPNLIKKLHQLEELTIIVDPRDQSWKRIADNIADEVDSLKHLTIRFRCFPGEASPSEYVTPSEGLPSVNGHGIIRSQQLDRDYDIPLVDLNHNHNNGEIQEASSSNSMAAAARPLPPSDPSPSTWASHHSPLSV